jgi:hypothetical protein
MAYKIHAHAGFPPTPCMFEIAAFEAKISICEPMVYADILTAISPPNAPDRVVADVNKAVRICKITSS